MGAAFAPEADPHLVVALADVLSKVELAHDVRVLGRDAEGPAGLALMSICDLGVGVLRGSRFHGEKQRLEPHTVALCRLPRAEGVLLLGQVGQHLVGQAAVAPGLGRA